MTNDIKNEVVDFVAEMQLAEIVYWDRIRELQTILSEQHIKPFCAQHGFTFIAGMGTWAFRNNGKTVHFDSAEEMAEYDGAEELHNLMLMSMENGHSVGLHCADID
jgi:hypothetical protein